MEDNSVRIRVSDHWGGCTMWLDYLRHLATYDLLWPHMTARWPDMTALGT
jgi:hypothetical protein